MWTGRPNVDGVIPDAPVVMGHVSCLAHKPQNPRLDLRNLDADVKRQVISPPVVGDGVDGDVRKAVVILPAEMVIALEVSKTMTAQP